LARESRLFDTKQFLILATPEVVSFCLTEESSSVAELQEILEKTFKFQVENSYIREQYDIIPY